MTAKPLNQTYMSLINITVKKNKKPTKQDKTLEPFAVYRSTEGDEYEGSLCHFLDYPRINFALYFPALILSKPVDLYTAIKMYVSIMTLMESVS